MIGGAGGSAGSAAWQRGHSAAADLLLQDSLQRQAARLLDDRRRPALQAAPLPEHHAARRSSWPSSTRRSIPGLLIAAQAAGVDLSSVLSEHRRPAAQLPLYRRSTRMALDFVNAVRAYGAVAAGRPGEERRRRTALLQQTYAAAASDRRQPDLRLAGAAGAKQHRRI